MKLKFLIPTTSAWFVIIAIVLVSIECSVVYAVALATQNHYDNYLVTLTFPVIYLTLIGLGFYFAKRSLGEDGQGNATKPSYPGKRKTRQELRFLADCERDDAQENRRG